MFTMWLARPASLLIFAAALLAAGGIARADGAPRVTLVQGAVQVQAPSGAQSAAVVNGAIVPGDYVTTASNARAEIQFDADSMLRLSGGVQARVGTPGNDRIVQLADGTIDVSILQAGGPIVVVDTPSVTIRATQPGSYRISIGPNGATFVTARRGYAEAVTPAQIYPVEAGKTLVATGAATNPSVTYTAQVAYDSFDQFNADRDAAANAVIASQSTVVADNGYANSWWYVPSVYVPACSYVPFGIGYGGWGWGVSIGVGFAGGCGYGGLAWYAPVWGWPAYGWGPYWNVGYYSPWWNGYPAPYYPYPPAPWYPPSGGGNPPPLIHPVRRPVVPIARDPRGPGAGGGSVTAPIHVARVPIARSVAPLTVARVRVPARAPVSVAKASPVKRAAAPLAPVAKIARVAKMDPGATARSASWARFDKERGTSLAVAPKPVTAPVTAPISGAGSTMTAAHSVAPISTSWERFTSTRGTVVEPIAGTSHVVSPGGTTAGFGGTSGGGLSASHSVAPIGSGGAHAPGTTISPAHSPSFGAPHGMGSIGGGGHAPSAGSSRGGGRPPH